MQKTKKKIVSQKTNEKTYECRADYFVETYINRSTITFVNLAIKNTIVKLINDTIYKNRVENLIELYIVAKISICGDLTTSEPIKLKYNVMRVCMKIDITKINKMRG